MRQICTAKEGNVLTNGPKADWDRIARDSPKLPPSRFFVDKFVRGSPNQENCFGCGSFARRRSHLPLGFQRSKQRYGGAMVTGNDLAMDGGPRAGPTHRQGDVLAPVQLRR